MIAPRSGGLDLGGLNSNLPLVTIPGINSTREAQYARRIKELEDEFRALRAENEKNVCFHSTRRTLSESGCHQKAMIVKFRERWDKLKESAKRKKEAKMSAEATTTGAREKIVEEPEAEEELDQAAVGTLAS